MRSRPGKPGRQWDGVGQGFVVGPICNQRWYENETGEQYHRVAVYNVRLDTSGKVAIERFRGRCPRAPDTEFSFIP